MPGGGKRPHPASSDHLSVCNQCGGASLRGVAAPSYGNGKWSLYVPPNLRDAFEATLNDPDMLNFGRVISLMSARQDQLLRQLDTGETGRTWAALASEAGKLSKLMKADELDRREVEKSVALVDQLVNHGRADAAIWAELFELWDQMRETVETEMKRREKGRQLVPIEDVMWHVRATLLAAREAILNYPGLDRATRDGLLQAIGRVYNQRYGTRSAKLLDNQEDGANGHGT
jgi:hypothetical protein